MVENRLTDITEKIRIRKELSGGQQADNRKTGAAYVPEEYILSAIGELAAKKFDGDSLSEEESEHLANILASAALASGHNVRAVARAIKKANLTEELNKALLKPSKPSSY